jgi:hypothetical protein
MTEAVVKVIRQDKLHDLTKTIPPLRLDRSNNQTAGNPLDSVPEKIRSI